MTISTFLERNPSTLKDVLGLTYTQGFLDGGGIPLPKIRTHTHPKVYCIFLYYPENDNHLGRSDPYLEHKYI